MLDKILTDYVAYDYDYVALHNHYAETGQQQELYTLYQLHLHGELPVKPLTTEN